METKTKTVDMPAQTVYTRDDYILDSLKDLREAMRDLKDGQKELRQEIKEVRKELHGRCDKIEEEIRDVRTELHGRCDKIENEMRNMIRHSQILTASVFGLIVAVIFSLTK